MTSVSKSTISQKQIVKSFEGWSEGTFDKSFVDLARAGRDVKALEFSDIQKVLSENGTKGSEVFEAFGMKFPAGQITLWGALLILGIQLYLLAYLRLFSAKSRKDDEQEAVWIGLDSSRLGKSMFFATLVLFPCIAIASLFFGFWHKPSAQWTAGTRFELALLCVGFVCCIFLSVCCWINRPRNCR